MLAAAVLTPQLSRAQAADEPATDQVAPAAAGEIKNVAVVAVSSYNQLIADVGFMGSLAERPELGQMIEGTIALFT